MKATLEFNLPEEAGAFEAASNASALASALWQIMANFRHVLKYDENLSDQIIETVEALQGLAYDELEGLDLERMIG